MAKKAKPTTPNTPAVGVVKTVDNQVDSKVVVTKKIKFQQETATPLSCLLGSPMMEFGTGNAPVLDYEIPQRTSFPAYGTSELTPVFATSETENDVFTDIAFGEPLPITNFPTTTPNTPEDQTSFVANGVINTSFQENDNTSVADVKSVGGQVNAPKPLNLPTQQYISQQLALRNVVVINDNFGGFGVSYTIVPRPGVGRTKPTFFFVEEYTVASYLANYGAGKTLNTFTLLPSEKTSITIRTYKESTETKKRAENVMDSFSEDSAKEFENTLEKEASTKIARSATNSISASVSLSIPIKIISVGVSASIGRSVTKSREANTRCLSKSIEKHANKTNSSRKVEVSSSSENSQKEGEEITTVRNLVNPNQSRVLNFVFRQLLQEYVTIMYLSNVKIGFSNGHPESQVIVPIEKLDELLETYVKPDFISRMRDQIIFEYLTITNYKGFNQAFLEKITKPIYSPSNPNATVDFYTKRKSLIDTYELALGNGTRTIAVNGVILSVEKNTLFTISVIVDSLLGQGEALDCFNAKIQEASSNQLQLENNKMQLALNIIAHISDPVQQAEAYAKMFNPPIVPPQNP